MPVDLTQIWRVGQPAIPSVYGDALSYLEEVAQLKGGVVKIAEQSNENEKNLKQKVSREELQKEYKLEPGANYTGAWFGITNPAMADPGIAGQVMKNTDDIIKLREFLNYMHINGGDFDVDGNNPPDNPFIDGGIFSLQGGS